MVQYVSIKEASQLTGLSVFALRKGVRIGRFPHLRQEDAPRNRLLIDLRGLALVLASDAYAFIRNKEEEKEND